MRNEGMSAHDALCRVRLYATLTVEPIEHNGFSDFPYPDAARECVVLFRDMDRIDKASDAFAACQLVCTACKGNMAKPSLSFSPQPSQAAPTFSPRPLGRSPRKRSGLRNSRARTETTALRCA